MSATKTHLNATRRQIDIDALVGGELVDVLVVGGGITGAGVALDAASRGLSVALVEKNDLAAGTSRWSSKLAHGGLRYITAGQVGVAWESAVERNALATRIAPHLVRPMPFLLPMLPDYPHGARAASRLLLSVADLMRAAARTPSALPRGRWADRAETTNCIPTIDRRARGAYIHVDGALEDDARLVVGVARTAAGFGAKIITHCTAIDVSRDGARVHDSIGAVDFEIKARAVVAATGVWTGTLVDGVPLQPSKGAHVVLRAEALGRPTTAFNVLLPGTVNRFVFAVPRPDGTVLVGLTDDAVDTVEDVPAVTEADEKFLLDTLSSGLRTPVTSADVIGRYAGLRPLLGQAEGSTAADLSRRHALLDRDGVTVIVGGKLTTYRRMAQDTIDSVAHRLGNNRPCRTATLPLVGADISRLPGQLPSRLVRRFGGEAAEVAAAGSVELLADDGPVLRCELDWAIRAEGAITVEDALERRLRLDLVDSWREAAMPAVSEVLATA